MDQHLPSSTNIYLPYQFEQPHMYYFESRLEVSAEETPHVLGSEDGFQYIQHEVPNKSRNKMSNKTYYYINTNEIPGELLCENLVSSHVKITCYLHM